MRNEHRSVLEEKERRLNNLSKEVEDLIGERNGLRLQLDKTAAKAQDLHQKHRAASKNLSGARLAKRRLESYQPPAAPGSPPACVRCHKLKAQVLITVIGGPPYA
jgi:chromosome segregation ATPase